MQGVMFCNLSKKKADTWETESFDEHVRQNTKHTKNMIFQNMIFLSLYVSVSDLYIFYNLVY